jgi:hypothetical protein
MDDTQVENLNKKIDALIKKETPSEDQKSAETEKSATETKAPEDTKKSDEN